VDDQKLGTLLRLARIRKDKRQSDVARDAGVSPSAIAKHERGQISNVTHRALRQHAQAVGVRIELVLRGPSSDLLRDEEHATVVDYLKRWLESLGWEAVVEASYSEFGERGRIDLFAYHAGRRVVLVVEVKTGIFDAQDLLGGVDVKERLAATLARKRGWRPATVSVLLAITRTDANERKIHRLAALFSGFGLRGREARAWLADPVGAARMLVFVTPSEAGRAVWRNSRQRVRRRPFHRPA